MTTKLNQFPAIILLFFNTAICGTAIAQQTLPPQSQLAPSSAEQPIGTLELSAQTGNPLRQNEPTPPSAPQELPTDQPHQTDNKVKPAVAVETVEESVSLTQTDIDGLLKKVNETTDLDEQQKKEATDRLKSATEWLKVATEAEAKTKQFLADIENSPTEIDSSKASLAVPLGEPKFSVPPDAGLTQVEHQNSDADLRLAQARETLAKREESLKRRGEKKVELTKLSSEMDQRLKDAKKLLADAVNENSLVEVARRLENKARYIALEKQKIQYPIEIKRIDARMELIPLLRDLAKREVAFLEKETAGWQQVVGKFRKRESDRQAAETRRQVAQAHPALKSLAEKNADLAESRKTLVEQIGNIEKEVQQSKHLVDQLKDDFDNVAEKVEKVGHSTTIGLLLRRQRDHLPDISDCRDRIRFIRETTPSIHLSALNLQDERDELADLDAAVEKVVAQLSDSMKHNDQQDVTKMVADLLQTKRDVLDKLLADHDQYVKLLGELELTQTELLEQNDKFASYIDERILWIRSSEPIAAGDAMKALAGVKVLASPGKWFDVGQAILKRVSQKPWTVLPLVLIVAFFVMNRRRLRLQVERICHAEESELRHHFLPTLNAILALSIAAAFWPGLMWLIGWQLTSAHVMPELGRACGVGLQSAVFAFWVSIVIRRLIRRGGVVERHFQWNGDSLSVARRHITWLAMLGVPIVFLVSSIATYDDGLWASSLGRIAFLAGCLLLILFAHVLLRSKSGVLLGPCSATPDAWFCRIRSSMYFLATGIPVSLAVLAALGYDYSATRLATRLQATAAVVVAVTLLRALALRWLAVRRERLLHTANQLSQSTESQKSTNESPDVAQSDVTLLEEKESDKQESVGSPPFDETTAIIEQTDSQVRYLLRYAVVSLLLLGGYVIWSDVTPALGVLDKVTLWSKYIDVKETLPDDETGTPKLMTTQKEIPTTLKHAVLAAFILVLGMVLARNLPALLQVLVLERMPIDQGQRYAAGMILRYITTLSAMIFACRELGLTWGSIQWLAAAMTVGLGFGLQEIFANLVSGLIILFERPIRVGDLVTVSGTTGRVTRMQIRATTITDLDRRELIVPNKKFITDDVMNWTLTDHVNRIVIEVGIAYGSDTSKARNLLLKVAKRHPLVLQLPEATATFDKFADSSLNLTLRCFLPNLDNRLVVIHELHSEIDREFRKADIEIAFPQQDLHVRSMDVPLRALIGRQGSQKDAA